MPGLCRSQVKKSPKKLTGKEENSQTLASNISVELQKFGPGKPSHVSGVTGVRIPQVVEVPKLVFGLQDFSKFLKPNVGKMLSSFKMEGPHEFLEFICFRLKWRAHHLVLELEIRMVSTWYSHSWNNSWINPLNTPLIAMYAARTKTNGKGGKNGKGKAHKNGSLGYAIKLIVPKRMDMYRWWFTLAPTALF